MLSTFSIFGLTHNKYWKYSAKKFTLYMYMFQMERKYIFVHDISYNSNKIACT